jgi:hypothetical protein
MWAVKRVITRTFPFKLESEIEKYFLPTETFPQRPQPVLARQFNLQSTQCKSCFFHVLYGLNVRKVPMTFRHFLWIRLCLGSDVPKRTNVSCGLYCVKVARKLTISSAFVTDLPLHFCRITSNFNYIKPIQICVNFLKTFCLKWCSFLVTSYRKASFSSGNGAIGYFKFLLLHPTLHQFFLDKTLDTTMSHGHSFPNVAQ